MKTSPFFLQPKKKIPKMIVIKETQELKSGKEYYLEYNGDKIKASIKDMDYGVIYFMNLCYLSGTPYFKNTPAINFGYIYPDPVKNIQKIIEKNPHLEICYLSVKQNVHKKIYTDRCFYSLQEIFYYDSNDRNQLVNIYITQHSEFNKVKIYLPIRDKIIEANNRITLHMVMEKYTCQDLARYVDEQGFL